MKQFKISKDNIQRLIPAIGGCIATDKITVEGLPVGYMYRESPSREMNSGWRFFSGTETQAYIDDLSNSNVYDLNTIANYDQSIIQYLDFPYGSELEKDDDGKFQITSG